MILTPSGTYKELCVLGLNKEKIVISNPGVDLALLDSVGPSQNCADAISIGYLLFNKGSYDLAKIWSKVVAKRNNAKLVIIGGGPDKEVELFRRSIEKLNLGANIEYLGFVKNIRDVYARTKSSKILILTGHENGWSIPVAEAFACGVPVVAYNLKMFGTAFSQGFITVPLHDTDRFAQEIVNLVNNEESRRLLAQEAYAEGRILGWDKVAQDLAQQIESLINNNR
jgi:glycosyltransferase involved in cell wall biosynthesis